MSSRSSTRLTTVAALSLILLALTPAHTARAATLCFVETGQRVGNRFGDFWQGNGGLPVFGNPIAAMAPETSVDTGSTHVTQWIERERLELHPENRAPYTILLGRLGAERLARLGRDWMTFPKANPAAPHYYPATGHAIGVQFWDYWRGHGLDLGDPGVSEREALALFGYPLSEPATERNQAGDTVLTQWFERALRVPSGQPRPVQGVARPAGPGSHASGRSFLVTALRGPYRRHGDLALVRQRDQPQGVSARVRLLGKPRRRTDHDAARLHDVCPRLRRNSYVAATTGRPSYDAGAGNFWATVPTVIVATTNSGGREVFAGCYVLRRTSPGADPRPDAALWKLNRARIDAEEPNASAAALLPGIRCDPGAIPPPAMGSSVR